MQANLAIIGSGNGSNAEALISACESGQIDNGSVNVVVCNVSNAGIFEVARNHDIDAVDISPLNDDPRERDMQIVDVLDKYQSDLVLLAGYNKIIGHIVLHKYGQDMINIHPAPLPDFGGPGMYGLHVHEKVLASGVKRSGPTVHWVIDKVDMGDQISHQPVDVLPDDTPETLATRVLEAEHQLYWRAVRKVLNIRRFTDKTE